MQVVQKKVPGGKLLRIKATVVEGKITFAQISGDFFLSPPEKISFLEDALLGFPISQYEELTEVIGYVIEREEIEIQGFSSEDVAELVGELQ